ncbi:MAG: nitronate monooxygenase [bacterium]
MNKVKKLPEIIQGGMGIGVSSWRLARTVSKQGQIGVVSGAAIDSVIARRLQLGDQDGKIRQALTKFPWPDIAQRILSTYFIPGGKSAKEPFKPIQMPAIEMQRSRIELMIIANFIEVLLAKEGHHGLVGINYLEKIQIPTLPSLLGAMLANVDFILMGAGIPISIPGALDALSCWQRVELKLHVEDNTQHHNYSYRFDPKEFCPGKLPVLKRPKFLAIISSDTIAKTLIRKGTGLVDGFIVENHTAGGHNAPPRKDKRLQTQSPQHYSPKDIPDIRKVRDLGRPFWLAGGYASPMKLKEALDLGANGIQIGTAFAFCRESEILQEIKQEVLAQCIKGKLKVFTGFQTSPTGYPFKLIHLKNTMTDVAKHSQRRRICDLGYLRRLYSKNGSKIGYRCPGEPVNNYLMKGGSVDETIGKQCLCNALLATIGLGQGDENGFELPIVTAGEDFSFVAHIIEKSTINYSAKDVIDYIKGSID